MLGIGMGKQEFKKAGKDDPELPKKPQTEDDHKPETRGNPQNKRQKIENLYDIPGIKVYLTQGVSLKVLFPSF